MSGPLKPSEVSKQKAKEMPEVVFKEVNRLIALNWDGHSSRFLLKDIRNALEKNCEEIYSPYMLDFEDCYRDVGWNVEYDAPGFNETYDANFTFRKK
jgi:hypothetical protein